MQFVYLIFSRSSINNEKYIIENLHTICYYFEKHFFIYSNSSLIKSIKLTELYIYAYYFVINALFIYKLCIIKLL